MPVTAKIRAGYDHADDVEVLARAVEAGGASLLTVHCRTRREGYQPEVDWTRIARAVDAVSIPESQRLAPLLGLLSGLW